MLRDQGVDAFARKILNVQEKRPRLAFAVIHEFLGVDGDPFWAMGGVRRTLNARGMDYRDIVLKSFQGGGEPPPTVLTHDEHKYERLEFVIADLEESVGRIEKDLTMWTDLEKDFNSMGSDELNKKYFYCALRGRPPESATTRAGTDTIAPKLYDTPEDVDVIAAVRRVAHARGVTPAEVALAWLLSRPAVVAPIVGATKPEHLDSAVRALDIMLTPEEIAELEAPYRPHEVKGH